MEDNNTIWKDLDIDSLQSKSEKHAMIPYFVHEGEMARHERTIKKLWILCILIFLALILTNAGWIYYEAQFEDVITTQEVDQDVDTGNGDGDVYVHGIGNIYGEDKTEGKNNNEDP